MLSYSNYWVIFIIFQLQWWGCVLSSKYDHILLGAVLVTLTWMIEFIVLKINWQHLKTIISWTMLGIALDSVQSYLGIIQFKNDLYNLTWLIPIWLILLWFCFSSWIVMTAWIRNYKLIVTILTLIIAPLSYWMGTRLGVVTLKYELLSLLSIAGGWLILITLILHWPVKYYIRS